jgi:outer membrane protein assembly factor BamE (lipoprotein component of BamABCDE complex)
MTLRVQVIAVFTALLLAGCAGYTSGTATKKLQPGMTTEQARGVMGSPTSTQFINNNTIWKYQTSRHGIGWVPVYLVFEGKSGRLVGWNENMGEALATQSVKAQQFDAIKGTALLPTQQNVNLNQRVSGSLMLY